ncbi:MAG: GNAT family N-acetyltransferase [Curvibacter sp.]|nr:GNAT family N-acetyltransferase [Curvibacter sp.]
MSAQLEVGPLGPGDWTRWLPLARAYKSFYLSDLSDAAAQQAWQRLMAGDGVFGLGVRQQGRLQGICHYLFHGSLWMPTVCYLQDLYVDEACRGQGLAAQLIEAVAVQAREAGASRLYWQTQATNLRARRLYERLGEHRGFIRYDHRGF